MSSPFRSFALHKSYISILIFIVLNFFLIKEGYCQTKDSLPVVDTLHLQDKVIIDSLSITTKVLSKNTYPEKDLKEISHNLFHPNHQYLVDTSEIKFLKKKYSFVPAVGYTLQTGFAVIGSGNAAYYTGLSPDQKISTLTTSITYSQYQQIIVPFQINIWTPLNKYEFITDFRFISYPSDIYGLGGRTDPNQGVTINFNGIKFHQSVLKSIARNLYLGLGYYLDEFWNIEIVDQVSGAVSRRVSRTLGKHESASGPNFRFVLDSRLNQINPHQGIYSSLSYRANYAFLGSDQNSQILQIDTRTYIPFPAHSKNILALWAFGWFVTGGNAPYLILPSTGWDDNYNTGRGYIQGRFRGKRMYYGESEYRFQISRNGLIGGVAFFNLETFSRHLSPTYNQLFPGYGLGLRIKINKHSGTNLCLDYGIGQAGSQGFFVNLGEVF